MRYQLPYDRSRAPQPLSGEALDRAHNWVGWPLLEISDVPVDTILLDRVHGDNAASRLAAEQVARKVVTQIAQLYGVDLRDLLVACDLHRAARLVFQELGAGLTPFLPIIAQEVFEGGPKTGGASAPAGPSRVRRRREG